MILGGRKTYPLIALIACLFQSLVQAELKTTLTTGLGRNLNPEESKSSLTFEPELSFKVRTGQFVATSLIDRPLNPHENFSVPRTVIGYFGDIPSQSASPRWLISLSFLDLDRWNLDGKMIRATAGFQYVREVVPGLTILLRLAPYAQWNEFGLRKDGRGLPRHGITERVYLTYQLGRVELAGRIILEQKATSLWKNDYLTYEHASYQVNKHLSWGLSHEILSSVVDSTGYARPVRLWDSRESRISTFLEMKL